MHKLVFLSLILVSTQLFAQKIIQEGKTERPAKLTITISSYVNTDTEIEYNDHGQIRLDAYRVFINAQGYDNDSHVLYEDIYSRSQFGSLVLNRDNNKHVYNMDDASAAKRLQVCVLKLGHKANKTDKIKIILDEYDVKEIHLPKICL